MDGMVSPPAQGTPVVPYVGRLAPSPTGALHLGNARTFLVAWLRARAAGGRLILRIEDLDHPKVKPGQVDQIVEDLHWLGLDWDEGPGRPGPHAPYIQSLRHDRFRVALDRLREQGLVYPCVCRRADVEAAQAAPHAGEDLRYPGTCRGRFGSVAAALRAADGRDPAWRFQVSGGATEFVDAVHGRVEADLVRDSGDFVLGRVQGGAGYQLAVVVDDAAMGVTEVVRGDDLLPSVPRQEALHRALGWAPPQWMHLPLVVGEDGRRLAKRHGDTRISALRAEGVPAGRITGWMAGTCGWAEPGEACSPSDLIPRFRLDRIPRTATVFGAMEHFLLKGGKPGPGMVKSDL